MADEAKTQDGWVDGKYSLKLAKKLRDPERDGEMLSALTLREPNGGDLIEAGNPVAFNPLDEENPFRVDEKKMGAMISRLAALPPSVIREMSTKDMLRASNVLAPFFLPFGDEAD